MNRGMTKTIIVGTAGTVIEWAEYAFYGYMAVPISKHFFPTDDHALHLFAAFAIFAAGFIMRPLGGVLFGHIGDRIGRKLALLISMLLMGIATLAIGCLPTYQQIGVLAPVLLLLCRLVQGLAVSSECLGAAVFLIEHARNRYPYLTGSWPGFAAALGMTLGGFAATIVTHPDAAVWAWRVPFFVGALGCMVALYLRQKVQESPEFITAKAQGKLVKMPLRTLLRGHSLGIFRTAAAAVFTGSLIYVWNIYFTTYLIEYAHFTTHDATLMTTLGAVMVLLFYPIVGFLADKTNGVRIIRYGLVLTLVMAPYAFYMAKTGIWAYALVGQLLFALSDALVTAPMFKWLYDQFPTAVRMTGIGVSWNIAIALLGGTGPMIAQYSTQTLGLWYGPALFISFAALLVWFSFFDFSLRARPYQAKVVTENID